MSPGGGGDVRVIIVCGGGSGIGGVNGVSGGVGVVKNVKGAGTASMYYSVESVDGIGVVRRAI